MYKYSSLNEATIDIKETFDIRLDLEKFFIFLIKKSCWNIHWRDYFS